MLEKLLAVLTALIASIDANTAALKGAKPGKPAKTEVAADTNPVVTPAPAVVFPTVQEVRDAAKALLDAAGNNDNGLFGKLCVKHGVKKVSEVPEAVRAEVIAEIKKATPAKVETPSAADQV